MKKLAGICIVYLVIDSLLQNSYSHDQLSKRSWTRLDGLNESAVMQIHSGVSGKVWFSHGPIDHISWLDGYKIGSIPSPGRYVPVIESEEGVLWSIYDKGVQRFENNEWTQFPLPLAQYHLIDFFPLSTGQLLLGFKEHIAVFDPESQFYNTVIHAKQAGWKQFNKMIRSSNGAFWVSGDTGLLLMLPNQHSSGAFYTWKEYFFSHEMPYHDLNWIWENSEGVIFGTVRLKDSKRNGIITWNQNQWHLIYTCGEKMDAVWQGFRSTFFILKQQKLYLLYQKGNDWVEKRIDHPYPIRNFEIESDSTFWVSTFHSVSRFSLPVWRTPLETQEIHYFVNSIAEDETGTLWFSTQNELLMYDQIQWRRFPYPEGISTYRHGSSDVGVLKNGKIAIRTTNQVILEFDPLQETFALIQHPEGYPVEAIFSRKNGSVWVQTGTREHFRIEVYDGESFQPFLDRGSKWNIEQLRYIFEESPDRVWFGGMGQDRVGLYDKGQYCTYGNRYPGDAAMCIIRSPSGSLWFSDRNSVFEYDGKEWSVIKSNLDQIPSMIVRQDGMVWAAAWSGLYRYDGSSWIHITDEDGLPVSELIKVFEDSRHNLWLGTYGGISRYHPEADPDAPMTMLYEKNRQYEVSPQGDARFNFSGVDKWKVTESGRLFFSYCLDQNGWSPYTQENKVYFTDLKAGKHTFAVRAMDRNFNVDAAPEWITFAVLMPWYKQTGFIIIILFCSVLITGLLILLIYRYIMLQHLVNAQTKDLQTANHQLIKDAYELSQAEKKLRSMALEVILVEERERKRLASVLHDCVGHSLAFLKIKLSELKQSVQPNHQHTIQQVMNITDQAIEETHSLTFELSPPVLYELGFDKALQWLVDQFNSQYPVRFRLQMEGRFNKVSEDLRIMLFQSVRELMVNIIKHSQADEARIVVRKNENDIKITVEDNGTGFSVEDIASGKASGYGIFNIRQRFKYFEGECAIESAPNQGAKIELTAPLAAERSLP